MYLFTIISIGIKGSFKLQIISIQVENNVIPGIILIKHDI